VVRATPCPLPRTHAPAYHRAMSLTIEGLRARAVDVPLANPLRTSGGVVASAPLVLIDLETREGAGGRAYLFVYTPLALRPVVSLLEGLGEALAGEALVPLDLHRKLEQRFRLLGGEGLTGMAMAGIDMAAWDALAREADVPLARLLGGRCRPIRAYNSTGLGMIGAAAAAREATGLLERGFRAIKVRLGYGSGEEDRAVVRAVRHAVGAEVKVMSDYNQSLSVPEAISRVRLLEGEGLEWIEEPVRADDLEGCARVARAARTPIQLGENCWGPAGVARALRLQASDLLMPDAMKVGGVTGWLRAVALTEAAGVPTSTHLFPEISAHLMAVTPTADWLEYVEFAAPVLREPLAVKDGQVIAPERPGSGIEWNEEGIAAFAVR
jgi:mandelate racemase